MLPRDQWARLSPPEAGQGASHHDRRCVAPACSRVLPWFAGLGRGIPGFSGLAIGGASRSRAGWRGLRQGGQREHGHEAGQERSRHSLTHGEFLHSFQIADERSRCRGGCRRSPEFFWPAPQPDSVASASRRRARRSGIPSCRSGSSNEVQSCCSRPVSRGPAEPAADSQFLSKREFRGARGRAGPARPPRRRALLR
jgi:hypothetical protein